ncbi:MAG: isocitrate lyase/phosphoenolpyruvate mutase family protein [Pseudomonadota bacterium]
MGRLELRPSANGGAPALIAPGVFDAMSALIATQAGAKALYLSGASVSYTQVGRPDLGFVDLSQIADVAARITDRTATPLIVDADTGFGNALNVERTVRLLERAGAAAIQIEDQQMPKRCGHLAGKTLISAEEMCGKIAAACAARNDPHVKIIARTDAVAVDGLAAAFDRANNYIEAGADVLFIEALRSDDEMARAADAFADRVPMLANMVEGGRTPMKSAAELGALGFTLVICPGALARVYAFAAQSFMQTLLEDGSSAPFRDRMLDFDAINALLGGPELMERANVYGGPKKQAAE